MKYSLSFFVLLLVSVSIYAQGIRITSITYNDSQIAPPMFNYDDWYDIAVSLEYKGNMDKIYNCHYGIGVSQGDLLSQILLKYCHADGNIYVVKHETWNEPEMMGKPGENTVIENDNVKIDLSKSKVDITEDTLTVVYHIRFKDKIKGYLTDYVYAEDSGLTNTGFVGFNTILIGSPEENIFVKTLPKEWKNTLKPKGGKKITFAGKEPLYQIVIADDPLSTDEKAAVDLKAYFDEMSGLDFRIIKESEYKKGKFISIGKTKLSQKAPSYSIDLGTEGYAIDIVKDNIYIFGGRGRGCINAVYSMLEEDFGCRFYTLADQYVPTLKPLAQTVTPRVFLPVLDLRDPYVFESWKPIWSLKNKTNAPNANIPLQYGGSIKYYYLVHTYFRYFPPEEYFKDHPEYFSEINGVRSPVQLCNTNPDVIRLSIEKTKQIFRDNPSATITSISPNDGRGFCDCPNCKAMDDANGGRSGSYFYLVNEVAKGIRDEFPDKKILALAYLDYADPPTNMKIEDNVIVQLCTDAHAWKYQFCFTTESDGFSSYMKKWGKSGAGIFIWDYVADYVHMLVPMPNMPVVRDNMKFYIDNNAKGIMLQGTCYSNGGDMADMRSWVWAKQLWNIDRDTKELMHDFIYGYYRECAEPIWNYQMMLWNYWEENHAKPHKCGEKNTGNPLLENLMCSCAPDGPMFTEEFMNKFWEYIDEAESLAQSDEMLWKVKKIKASLLYLELAQNLGYMTEFRDFAPGKSFNKGVLKNKEKYEAYFKEFNEICDYHQITNLSEQNNKSDIIAKWEAVLAAEPTDIISQEISNEWIFKFDEKAVGDGENWQSQNSIFDKVQNKSLGDVSFAKDADGFSRVRSDINAGWEAQGYPDCFGNGWYFQKFTLNNDIKACDHIYLYMSGCDEEAWVYLNGKLICEHSVASTGKPITELWNDPFMVDIKDVVNKDGSNNLCIKVHNTSMMGGVWKPVKLYGSKEPKVVADFDIL